MKTSSNITIRAYLLLVTTAVLLTSCVYHDEVSPSDGYDGTAYVRLNWYDNEPNYIDPGNIIPSNFYWDTYYTSSPGFYTVYYEYDYDNGIFIDTYAYEADVEVWINEGQAHSGNQDGLDGADTYFDLGIFSDGDYDYSVYEKSGIADDSSAYGTVFKTITKQLGNKIFSVAYKKVKPRGKN